MPKSRIQWPEIVFGGGSASSRVSRAAAKGELTRIGPALYTSRTGDAPVHVVARYLWPIVAHYAPGAVVSHRTAFDGRPGADGTVFMTGPVQKRLDIPGLQLRVAQGPASLPGDQPFLAGLSIASEPRLLLENLTIARQRTTVRRTVPREAVEERLETILRSRGESALNAIRDRARELAPLLGVGRAMARLDTLISALLGSRSARSLVTSAGKARATGAPIDPERIERFELLARTLPSMTPPARLDTVTSGAAFEHLAFFDAYFSNYIEGTEFEVDEARAIIFGGAIPVRRPEDAHDILGTYRLVGSPTWIRRSVVADLNAEAFLARLADAHRVLMEGRPGAGPGEWKTRPDQAGVTRFVEPELTHGTLARGWELARAARTAVQRAAMIMFVVTEVHPFTDGNGRVARAFMNAELASAGERRIIIPTVFRDDYLGALRALSRQDSPTPFMLMLDQAQRFTASVRWADYAHALEDLTVANAFLLSEPGVRLRIPRTAV